MSKEGLTKSFNSNSATVNFFRHQRHMWGISSDAVWDWSIEDAR